jgi:hypothetical protein
VANKNPEELERRIARVGERTHAEAQQLRLEFLQARNTLAAGVRDLTRSRALLGTVFAAAAAAGVWAGMRRRERAIAAQDAKLAGRRARR